MISISFLIFLVFIHAAVYAAFLKKDVLSDKKNKKKKIIKDDLFMLFAFALFIFPIFILIIMQIWELF